MDKKKIDELDKAQLAAYKELKTHKGAFAAIYGYTYNGKKTLFDKPLLKFGQDEVQAFADNFRKRKEGTKATVDVIYRTQMGDYEDSFRERGLVEDIENDEDVKYTDEYYIKAGLLDGSNLEENMKKFTTLKEAKSVNKKSVANWWKEVEQANKDNNWGFSIDNGDYTDFDGMVAAMFDMLRDLKKIKGEKAKALFKSGKSIYNKYATVAFKEAKETKYCLNMDIVDDDIADIEDYVSKIANKFGCTHKFITRKYNGWPTYEFYGDIDNLRKIAKEINAFPLEDFDYYIKPIKESKQLKEGYIGQTLRDFLEACAEPDTIDEIALSDIDCDDFTVIFRGKFEDIPEDLLDCDYADFDCGGDTIVVNVGEDSYNDYYDTLASFLEDYNGDDVEVFEDGTIFTGDYNDAIDEFGEKAFQSFDAPKYICINIHADCEHEKIEEDMKKSKDNKSLTEAPDSDGIMTDDELDAEEEKARAEFEAKLKAKRAAVADQRKQRDEKAAHKAELEKKAQELLSQIGDDWSLSNLFNILVPQSGKADTYAGELIRAVNKIQYRWFNDGDKFFEDYGIETAGPAAYFLMNFDDENGKYPFRDFIIEFAQEASNKYDEDKYETFIGDLAGKVIDYIKDHKDLLGRDDHEDMLKVDYDIVKDEFDSEDMIPYYDLEVSMPRELQQHLEKGNIDESDIESWIEDEASNYGRDTSNLSVTIDGDIYIEGMEKATYDDFDEKLYDWLTDWARDLTEEHGDPTEEEEDDSDDADDVDDAIASWIHADWSDTNEDGEDYDESLKPMMSITEALKHLRNK